MADLEPIICREKFAEALRAEAWGGRREEAERLLAEAVAAEER